MIRCINNITMLEIITYTYAIAIIGGLILKFTGLSNT